ncbi:hypothetical protein CEXT_478731 [Caerostris extrusa]|uniref:Uncharacterized protein n=1 Tax=Caerostris extrusa TaxID=172846 RepID=A0AAV4XZM7_CAEEX|nr:hypothetical protein CEXT_478731 [Caerostris extrusa]
MCPSLIYLIPSNQFMMYNIEFMCKCRGRNMAPPSGYSSTTSDQQALLVKAEPISHWGPPTPTCIPSAPFCRMHSTTTTRNEIRLPSALALP